MMKSAVLRVKCIHCVLKDPYLPKPQWNYAQKFDPSTVYIQTNDFLHSFVYATKCPKGCLGALLQSITNILQPQFIKTEYSIHCVFPENNSCHITEKLQTKQIFSHFCQLY